MAVHDDPDAEQLLVHYLRPKLDGEGFAQGLVPFCDLYGDQEPWQIWEAFKESSVKDQEREDLYFITQHKKSPKNSRKSRTISSGTWKGDDGAKKVLAASRKVIGKRKDFITRTRARCKNGRWLMHEFELDASLLQNKRKGRDYVLCILRENNRSEKNNLEGQEDQEKDKMSCDDGDDQQDGELHDHEPEFVEEETSTTQKPGELRKCVMDYRL